MKKRIAVLIAVLLAFNLGVALAATPAAGKSAAAAKLDVTYYYLPG